MQIFARYARTLIALVFLATAPMAHAIVDPPTFTPSTPTSTQPITASVRNGGCEYFILDVNGPPKRIERSPGFVDVFAPGVITFEPFCLAPFAVEDFNIGVLPAGSYQVRVWIMDEATGYVDTTQVSSAPLTVAQGMVEGIPTLGTMGLMGLVALTLLIGAIRLRNMRHSAFLMVAILASGAVSAQTEEKTLLVLLSAEPGAPTPEELVVPIDFSAGYLGALSSGFVAENPTRAFYLLRERASGDFADWIAANPNEARAKLERYVVVLYPESANLSVALDALEADVNVEYAYQPEEVQFATAPATNRVDLQPNFRVEQAAGAPPQDWITMLNLSNAWQRAGGWGLVVTLDNGLNVTHPDLISFNGSGQYTGGNFLPVYAGDVGRTTAIEPYFDGNVDELEPEPATAPVCDPDGDGLMISSSAGHGTHVAGLIGANPSNGDATVGACKHCGIAPWRVSKYNCLPNGFVVPRPSIPGISAGLTIAADFGGQVVNQSFGIPASFINCSATPSNAWCLAMVVATNRGLLLAGASGNERSRINFPSADARVVAAGGLEEDGTFWDDRLDLPPSSLIGGCPNPALFSPSSPVGTECGSNFTGTVPGERRQESVLPARNVYSTIYPGMSWNPVTECGDAFGDASGSDGRGMCTGTSMSAPLYSGLVGLMRSVNPLLLPGDPENSVSALGVRDVVVDASVVPGGILIWDPKYGYGIPNADVGVILMLGNVAGKTVKNRVTPLFSFYGAAATDWAYTTVPQASMALIINAAASYAPQGTLVASYSAFPESPTAVPQPPAPRANTFVLTTEYRSDDSYPSLVPLYWMQRARNTPLGCTTGSGCNTVSRDFLLFTTTAEVETAKADGFDFRGIQGYVYNRCTPEPSCIPPSAEKLYRKCNTTEDDCAIFLESERVLREGQGYTTAYPTGSNMHIGYAYPNVDTDGDGLIDGFERVIGTRHDIADSDGDGASDSVEFPLAGVRVSDPCSGPNNQCLNAPMFANGFE